MKLINNDCIIAMKQIESNSVDAIVTDPPYELGFMGKSWDNTGIANNVEMWRECLRVLKPGGYLLSFGGTRTYHRMASAIEDAGFEVRDMIEWVYGSGFPKSTRYNLSPKFCQCALIGRNVENTTPLQSQDDHNNKELGEHDDDHFGQDAQNLKNESQDSLDDYQRVCGSDDEQPLDILSHDQGLVPSQGCVQEHNHSSSHDDGRASESLHNPSEAQYIDHPSNQDYLSHSATCAEHQDTPSSHKLPSDKFYKSDHKQHILDNSYPNYIGGFPVCKGCGKPNADGWGTALKPAHEPICMARKPLSEKTVADNCLKWGTGGINIDESRVNKPKGDESGWSKTGSKAGENRSMSGANYEREAKPDANKRFPANLIHDNSEEVRECFPETKTGAVKTTIDNGANQTINLGGGLTKERLADSGNASRFFKSIIYTAKASKSERNKGCENIEQKQTTGGGGLTADIKEDGTLETASAGGKYGSIKAFQSNFHPTVKPIKLMEYLINMVSRQGATILDPFMGSGSTGVACQRLDRDFIGIELDKDYFQIAKTRIENETRTVPPSNK